MRTVRINVYVLDVFGCATTSCGTDPNEMSVPKAAGTQRLTMETGFRCVWYVKCDEGIRREGSSMVGNAT